MHYWLALVRETLGIEGDVADFAIEVHEPNRARMRQWLAARRTHADRAVVAIAPAAAYGPAKEWPLQSYSALVDLLADRFEAECVLVGAPAERGRCEEVARASRRGAVIAAGETNVGELVALLSICGGFIGNDSGCAHVAGALGIPSVAIFGSTDPNRTGPLGASAKVIYRGIECSPCFARTCRFGHYNCLRSIEPAEVADSPGRPRSALPLPTGRRLRAGSVPAGAESEARSEKVKKMKLKELASRLGLQMRGDGEIEIALPAPIEAAGPGAITFVAAAKYLPALRESKASCAIVLEEFAAEARCATLISRNPYFDFARVLEIFFPPYRPSAGIDSTARIAPDASIGDGASIGAYCVIGSGSAIGRGAVIHPHVTIYPQVRIGDHFVCHSHVSIREGVTIGNHVTVLNGAVIGGDGFGFVEHDGELFKIPQVGGVIIEDHVEIGANTTIDRATIGATIVRRGAKFDNLVQVGHNCEIGAFSRFAAQTGLAGSTRIGTWCQFGGQSGCADHIRIGDRVMAAAQSGIPGNVGDDAVVGGSPAIDIRLWRRASAVQPRLPELVRRVRALEKQLDALAGKPG